MTAVLIIPLAFADAGDWNVVRLPVRDRDAALRGRRGPEPVRQTIVDDRIDVRLHRARLRSGRRDDVGLGARLVLLLHRDRRALRLRPDERAVPLCDLACVAAVARTFSSSSAARSASQSPGRTCASRRCSRSCSRDSRSAASSRSPAVILFKHGVVVRHQQIELKGGEPEGHRFRRRGVHLLARRVRGRLDDGRRGEKPAAQRAQGGDLEPDPDRCGSWS